MLLYYITDRLQFPGTESQKRERLLAKIAEAAQCGVDFIQLREKDLSGRELEQLAREAVRVLGEARGITEQIAGPEITGGRIQYSKPESRKSKLLINSRTDVALACGADGVHLTSTDIPASDARAVWARANSHLPQERMRRPTIAVSCHTAEEVLLAEAHGADFVVFAPVFEKVMAPARAGVGLAALRKACRRRSTVRGPEATTLIRVPVLALGGITLENASECVASGAAGIAGIRLFQEHEISTVVAALRTIAISERRP